MTCKHCGTEIAQKALICYRCGQSTTDATPVATQRTRQGGRPALVAAVGLVFLVLAGLFMASAAAGQVPRWLSWSLAGLAAVVLVWRMVRRRVKR